VGAVSDASFADPRIATLAGEFSRLSSDDQYLVLALVSRLAGQEQAGYAPDVPFMDFEE
jgi:hypothetical protein